jgi:hypothetical protein
MIDEMSGFIIVIVLIFILLLWPGLNSCRQRFGGYSYNKPCIGRPMYFEGLETAIPVDKSVKYSPVAPMPYNELIQKVGLPKSVEESHKEFTTDNPHSTTVSSRDTVRDDPNDVNPWIGLRRPRYHVPIANTQPDSRIVSSETPSQMRENKAFTLF